jgi:putative flippase GtrA
VSDHRSRLRAQLAQPRIARFAAVAVLCTLLQLLILADLAALGVSKVLANGLGFALAAQVNFVLSTAWTWRDRPARRAGRRSQVTRWVMFNATAAGALAANELVFTLLTRTGIEFLAASLVGIACGAVLAFTVNNLVTFRARRDRPAGRDAAERRPDVGRIRARAQREGVAFFLPAYNEAVNLRAIVPGIVTYFRRLACPFTVIIVDDGSTRDDTYEAAERLAQAYPAQVQAVHHRQNQGYGAAVRTGIRAGLGTRHGLIGFCDADGQFEIESFGTLLAALDDGHADLSAGYRIARADPLPRRLMGRAWHWLSGLALGSRTGRDVDCGFKVFTRPVLSVVEPQISGEYAAVSPEILARARAAGYSMTEAGVSHQPRAAGRQTGSDLKVVLLSLLGLFQLRLTLRKEARHGHVHPAADSAQPAEVAADQA